LSAWGWQIAPAPFLLSFNPAILKTQNIYNIKKRSFLLSNFQHLSKKAALLKKINKKIISLSSILH
jgi:hypothetical protein